MGRGQLFVNAAVVPDLTTRDVADLAPIGGDWELEGRAAVDGTPVAVFRGTTGALPDHMITIVRGDWRVQVISSVVPVDELLRVAAATEIR